MRTAAPVRPHPPSLRTRFRPIGVAAALVAVAGSPTTVASQAPYVEPPAKRSVRGVLSDTLTLALSRHTVGGRSIETGTYSGSLPGRTWIVRPGDTLKIRVVNNLAFPGTRPPPQRVVQCGDPSLALGRQAGMVQGEMLMDSTVQLLTNLHTHGLQVSPVRNGDNPFVDLWPGQTCDFVIPIPRDQPPGLFWYHPHRHGATSKQSWSGLSGAIVVEGGLDDLPGIANAPVRTMVLQELWLNGRGNVPTGVSLPTAGSSPFTSVSAGGAVPGSFVYTVNGVVAPTIPGRVGIVERWRIVNAAPHRFFLLQLQGQSFWQVAQDGIALPRPVPTQTILMAPGNRVEVLVRATSPGSYSFVAAAYDQGHPGGPLAEASLGTWVVSAAGSVPPQAIPTALPPVADISRLPVARQRTVVFQGEIVSAPVFFTLNGRAFNPDVVPDTVRVGTVEEWTLVNRDVFQHPFHIHVNPFMVTEINGAPVENPIWWDTFALPPRGTVKVRMRVRPDVTGRTVYHCHILPHEDNGMMSAFLLQGPPPAAVSGGVP